MTTTETKLIGLLIVTTINLTLTYWALWVIRDVRSMLEIEIRVKNQERDDA